MLEKIIMAGFGGQGVMLIGQLLTYAGMYEDRQVCWLPSYGPEVRGGTANCHVTISDSPISSPIITRATAAIIMNNPSLEKFEGMIADGGDLLINSSLVDLAPKRTGVNILMIPANELSEQAGNSRGANMVMLGALLALHPCVRLDTVRDVLVKTMQGSRAAYIEPNMDAIRAGISAVVKAGQA